MQTIIRKKGSFDDLVFEVDLSEYGKTITDIDDVFFSVKKEFTDADEILFFKKKSGGTNEMEVTGTDTLVTVRVKWNHNEYNKLIKGEYKAGLFIKFNGDPVADENVNDIFKLEISQDFLRH